MQEIGNLVEKIMKENFLNLVKEIDIQIQEAESAPIMMDAKNPTTRHITIKRPRVTDKEKLSKAERKKKLVTIWLPDGRGERKNG